MRLGETPARLAGAAAGTPDCWDAHSGQALLRLPGIARYLVTRREVVVEPRGGSEDDVATFLIGPVLAALLQLRGMTVLHAAAVEAGAGAALLLGHSGSGKSVLARALVARGHGLLADHTTALTPAEGRGRPVVQPAYPRMRLWADSLPAAQRGPRVRAGVAKYWCEAQRFAAAPRPVVAVFLLHSHNREEFDCERLPARLAFRALWAHTSRKRLLDALGQRPAHYRATLELARRPFFRVRRPDYPPRVDELADLVAERLRGLLGDSRPSVLGKHHAIPETRHPRKGGPGSPKQVSPPASSTSRCPKSRSVAPSVAQRAPAVHPPKRAAHPGIFWITGYPKSGSTWLRAVLTNYLQDGDLQDGDLQDGDEGASINALVGEWGVSSRGNFDELIGVDSADLRPDEVARHLPRFRELLAAALSARRRRGWAGGGPNAPHFAKTHEAFQGPVGGARFSAVGTAGAVYLVRNPLDVAVSYAHHLQWSVDRTIARMANPAAQEVPAVRGIRTLLPNPLRTWSEHVATWLAQKTLPTCVAKYEDLLADPHAGFGRIIRFAGLDWQAAPLARAIDHSAFSRLRAQEAEQPFNERQQTAPSFFRAGVAGGWRDALTRSQVRAIVAAHGPMMARLGYLREAEAFLAATASGCADAKTASTSV